MADLVFIVITVGFFAFAAAFVKVCEVIVGPDELAISGQRDETEPEPLAA